MTIIAADTLNFTFDAQWAVSKYDDWVFYKSQFQSTCGGGVKAVDLIAHDPARTAWFIEVKDYRMHARTKIADLADEVASKAFDTLAGLLPAQIGSSEPAERAYAKAITNAKKIRLVLHVEQPRRHSTLFPRVISLPDVQIKLRSLVRAIDAHAIVCEKTDLSKVSWSVA